jgi:hypothetical protein
MLALQKLLSLEKSDSLILFAQYLNKIVKFTIVYELFKKTIVNDTASLHSP